MKKTHKKKQEKESFLSGGIVLEEMKKQNPDFFKIMQMVEKKIDMEDAEKLFDLFSVNGVRDYSKVASMLFEYDPYFKIWLEKAIAQRVKVYIHTMILQSKSFKVINGQGCFTIDL